MLENGLVKVLLIPISLFSLQPQDRPGVVGVSAFLIPAAPNHRSSLIGHTIFQPYHRHSEVPMELSSTSASQIDNWRPISLAEDDIPTEWSNHPLWSETAFQANLEIYHQLSTSTDPYLQSSLQSALSCLHDAIRLYQPDSLIISFNGGKDAAVILYLTCAALAHYYDDHPNIPRYRPRAVYFDHPHEFPQVRAFTQATCQQWDVDLWAFAAGTSFPVGLTAIVEAHAPRPLAFVLGTRQGDPNAEGQTMFIPSSSSYMPPFLRVNPVLEWHYGHVWACLRISSSSSSSQPMFPYCSLYDEGYTSLGTTLDTLQCPALLSSDGSKYLPAYMLQDWTQERAGRIAKKKKDDEPKSSSATEMTDPNSSRGGDTTKTVGLLIIGDEILKGFCNDTNTGTAARALQQYANPTSIPSLKLAQVAIVADTLDAIVPAIQRLSASVDILVTSGGVGPTHDDVTIQAVAAALPSPPERHDAMAALVQEKIPHATEAVVDKMARLPECASLRYLDANAAWPILQCENIFVLPGVPQFFQEKMEAIARYYAEEQPQPTITTTMTNTVLFKVILGVDEVAVVDALNSIVEKYSAVTIGSYPQVIRQEDGSSSSRTVLTLQGDGTMVRSAVDDFIEYLPDKNVVLQVEENNSTLSLVEDIA